MLQTTSSGCELWETRSALAKSFPQFTAGNESISRSRPKETDCYSWHDTMFVTLSRMRPIRAMPLALGSLSPEAKRSQKLGLVVLCGVESFPRAGGLLCGQRSYRTIYAHDKRALFFQDRVYARGQLTGYRHYRFASGHLLRLALINAPIESAQFRILADRGPSTLNQLAAQTFVADAGNLPAIFLVAGRVLAGDQPQEARDLSDIFDLAPITEPRQRMGGSNGPDPGQARQKTEALAKFGITLTETPNLFLHFGC